MEILILLVLMHTGYYRPTASYPPPSVQELCATIQVLPAQDSKYFSILNEMLSYLKSLVVLRFNIVLIHIRKFLLKVKIHEAHYFLTIKMTIVVVLLTVATFMEIKNLHKKRG